MTIKITATLILNSCGDIGALVRDGDMETAHEGMRRISRLYDAASAGVRAATAQAVYEAHRIVSFPESYRRGVAVADLGNV